MQSLGLFSGGSWSVAKGHISADDSVVAGSGASALVDQAFHWENNTLDYNTLFDIAVKEFSC